MRVIAGTARSMPLKTPDGIGTRPTTDRIKETLFNILQPYTGDCIFLDLCSGSGGIGIEALSRGAKRAYFVENDRNVIKYLEENLKFTKLSDRAVILRQDAADALCQIRENEADIIFMDPPYNKGLEKKILERLGMQKYVTEHTLIVIESFLQTDFSYAQEYGFTVTREKRYKTNKHTFIRRNR